MAPCRRSLCTLGFLGSTIVIMLFFYHWDVLQEKRAEKKRHVQEQRKQLVEEMCNSDKEAFSEGKNSLEDMSPNELDNFVVDDTYGIIYCYIPKVACTHWKRIMFVLNQNELDLDLMSLSSDFIHHTKKLTLLSSFPRAEIKAKLKNYTKFMFVRDPFFRLMSAYRDKFLGYNKYYYENFARKILRVYGNQSDPPKTVDKAFALGVRPSFYNFIQYLLDPRTAKQPFEQHWKHMHRMCRPCLIQYDFIGQQETLQEDAEQLLEIVKLENDIKFPPPYENRTTAGYVLERFKTVPLEDRRKLYKLYEQDFRLFGYRKPAELLDG